ncbi:MAG TPA: type II toxin-antitoxin system YafQ family toxin [Rhizomicrobium sp.]|jgi:mRNA interferase YafQ
MKRILTTGRFEMDVTTLAIRRGLAVQRLWTLVDHLARGEQLAPRHRPRRPGGEWQNCRECHIAPDWLLIWREDETQLILVRTGSNADLFG